MVCTGFPRSQKPTLHIVKPNSYSYRCPGKAAEKRKLEKASAKAKADPAPKKLKAVKQEAPPAAEPAADAEWPEEWPEDFEDNQDLDGEEYNPEDEWDMDG